MEVAGVLRRSGAEGLVRWVVENHLGEPQIFGSVTEMAKVVDCIAIYAPNFTQLAIMREIAAAKQQGARVNSVIIDKPLGRNLIEAQELVDLAAKNNLRTAYFENQIFMKAVAAQRQQLSRQEKSMGPLSLVRSAEEHAGPHMPWFWDPTKLGGGVLLDMGCHSIAVAWYMLTPQGKPLTFLKPISVTCEIGLLKWGYSPWREKLKERMGIDYSKTPAEDFATGVITFENPETKQRVKAQFSDSWMYDKQGLRLYMDGIGPGYAFEINTQQSPVTVFIGDEAAGIADAESALEKSLSTRGLLTVQPNEIDLYGYTDENVDAAHAFLNGKDALLPFSYGYEITRLVMASYMAAEERRTIDLTDPAVNEKLKSFIPKVQQGRGNEVFSK